MVRTGGVWWFVQAVCEADTASWERWPTVLSSWSECQESRAAVDRYPWTRAVNAGHAMLQWHPGAKPKVVYMRVCGPRRTLVGRRLGVSLSLLLNVIDSCLNSGVCNLWSCWKDSGPFGSGVSITECPAAVFSLVRCGLESVRIWSVCEVAEMIRVWC